MTNVIDLTDARLLRAVDIERRGNVRKLRRHAWKVGSATHAGSYLVDVASAIPTCTCPDFATRGGAPSFLCKHAYAVLIRRRIIVLPSGLMSIDDQRPTYTQDWPAYNAAQQFEKEHVVKMLKALCGGIIMPPQGRARPRLPLADVVFACVMKVYGTKSGRLSATDLRMCKAAGLVDTAAHYNTVSRYLADPELTPILRALILESASPLADIETEFLVDSTGFSTGMYNRWYDHKYGKMMKHEIWVKAHVICGSYTHIITDVLVTDGNAADCPVLPTLLEQTAGRFTVERLCADKAYLSRRNFMAIDALGAVPYIPFKTGTTGKGPDVWRRMHAYYQYRRDEFLSVYHARSNVETVFSSIKRKFGAAVRSKTFVAQQNEVLCKVLAHNLSCLVMSVFELGLQVEFWKHEPSNVTSAA